MRKDRKGPFSAHRRGILTTCGRLLKSYPCPDSARFEENPETRFSVEDVVGRWIQESQF
jgi:hypothetical protein